VPLYLYAVPSLRLCAVVPLYVNDVTYFQSYVTDTGNNSLTFV